MYVAEEQNWLKKDVASKGGKTSELPRNFVQSKGTDVINSFVDVKSRPQTSISIARNQRVFIREIDELACRSMTIHSMARATLVVEDHRKSSLFFSSV